MVVQEIVDEIERHVEECKQLYTKIKNMVMGKIITMSHEGVERQFHAFAVDPAYQFTVYAYMVPADTKPGGSIIYYFPIKEVLKSNPHLWS